MKKNVAGQKIGAQMVDATTGAAFTSAVTVYVTGDAGTQAVGSVGAGACTHEGNGYHTYAPAQAETNYDLVAFTFIGTGAVPATVQVFTNFPQTGDGFARVGAPVGASISADIAAIQTDTNDIQSRIPAALVSGRIDASVGAMAANVITATAINADAITDAKVAADVTIASVTGSVGSVTGAVGSVTGAVGSVTGNVGGNVVGAVGSVTGNVGGNVVGSVGSVVAAVAITSNVKKNQALSSFEFVMTDSTTHAPATGKAVTVTRSIDGGAFGAGTLSAVTEVSNGIYKVNFGAGDLNGNVIVLRATATACDDTFERIVTQP